MSSCLGPRPALMVFTMSVSTTCGTGRGACLLTLAQSTVVKNLDISRHIKSGVGAEATCKQDTVC